MRCCRSLVVLTLVCVPVPALAAQESSDWDVTEARGTTRNIDFTTSEGTWTSVDVAPDGTWLVFDLLGHVYRMPSTGGPATLLTENTGVALNFHPSVSPDGSSIAFISDRAGQNNLWIMDADGGNPRSVFVDTDVRASMPAWSPDGEYLVVRRDYVGSGNESDDLSYDVAPEADREAVPQGRSGLWMYHRAGGTGTALVGTEVPGARWPAFSPDGRYLYFHATVGGREALTGHYQLRRLDLESGRIINLTPGTADGSGGRPAVGRGCLRARTFPRRPLARVRTPGARWHRVVQGTRVRAAHGALGPGPGHGHRAETHGPDLGRHRERIQVASDPPRVSLGR